MKGLVNHKRAVVVTTVFLLNLGTYWVAKLNVPASLETATLLMFCALTLPWLVTMGAMSSRLWGDAPNQRIYVVGGCLFLGLQWATGQTVLSWDWLWQFPFWALNGVIFWKGACVIRYGQHPWEQNPKVRIFYLTARTLREVRESDIR